MNLKQLADLLDSEHKAPPLDQWNPTLCGEMNLTIKRNGEWWHEGHKINRPKLIALFAKVLVKENDDFFLKTPIEKIKIEVEDAPFLITSWRHVDTDDGLAIEVSSNLNHNVILSPAHSLSRQIHSGQEQLYVELFRGLKGLVHRNVFYQWVEQAQEKEINGQTHLILTSGSQAFSLGQI